MMDERLQILQSVRKKLETEYGYNMQQLDRIYGELESSRTFLDFLTTWQNPIAVLDAFCQEQNIPLEVLDEYR
jgi:UDP-N-acetylglucosamine 2-epimerase